MNTFGLRVAEVLALRLFLVFLFIGQCRIEIDLSEFANQVWQNERVGIVRIQKRPALFGQIGFIRFLVDREEEFLFELKQFFFARVGIERKLRLIDRPAFVRVLHHSQQLLIARLSKFHLEH